MNANAGTAAGNTWHVTAEMPSDFDWVQLVYRSIEPGAIVITSAAVADPDAPHQFLPVYDSGDHSHMTDAGYAAAAVPKAELLKEILGL